MRPVHPRLPEGRLQLIDGKPRLVSDLFCDGLGACIGTCPEGAISVMEREAGAYDERAATASDLRQWPIQVRLLNPAAGYFDDADLLVAADCAPFACADFDRSFLAGRVLIIFCPRLDAEIEEYVEKLAEIFSRHTIRSVTVLRMEVPCCGGVRRVVDLAFERSGKQVPVTERTITIGGGLAPEPDSQAAGIVK